MNSTTGVSTDSCDPLEKSGSETLYPCGLIANSKFNDEFLAINVTRANGQVEEFDADPKSTATNKFWTNTGIAWKSDREDKFKNRTIDSTETKYYIAHNITSCAALLGIDLYYVLSL
jgi:hypothetical protein